MNYKPKYWFFRLLTYLAAISFTACIQEFEPQASIKESELNVPAGFPEVPFPADNSFTIAKWKLGKKLFYDPIMSVDSTKSCNSCHKQEYAFADNVAFSDGVKNRPGTRNSPSLANVAYQPYFTREGGVPSLEMQVLVPIQEHNEFDFNILLIEERLKKIPVYIDLSKKAFNREPDYYVITRALATFERSLISGNSPYDQYTFNGNDNALTRKQQKGMELFFSNKTGCSNCHSGFNFSNYAFENNGLYIDYSDVGRKRLTGNDKDEALFKVPSLRNVALTAPYMHDGSMATLDEVIDHYNNGGENHFNKSELLKPLGLSENEKAQLIAFLQSLTDDYFINNNEFKKDEN
ncbi:MAG: cytochrome-c peroxidase [Bacteroidia bacterium]